jgi:pimeloyl-ACP methyl ester carboxylesterase
MKPLTSSACDIAGHQIAYFRRGDGETILLVHGITTYAFIWKRIVPLLEPHYEVVGVDLLGCGASSKSMDQPYSIKNHAHLLKQFLEKLGIAKVHFVGHDVGGGIGQIFAVNYPEMLYDLTLINSVAYDFWPVQPIVAMRTPIIRQLAMATLDMGALRLVIRRGLYHKANLTPELFELFWEPMKTKQGRKAFLHFAACLDNHHLLDISDELHQLDLPVLIIRGDADPYLSRAIAQKLAENIPHSRLVIIPTASHFIQEDEPEMLANEITKFYAGNAYV